MLIVLSPSKDLDYKREYPQIQHSLPEFAEQTQILVELMQKKSVAQLKKLMDISEKLAMDNQKRYRDFEFGSLPSSGRPALFAFSGDVYRGLDAYSLDENGIRYCNRHVRILSGLYGMLKPLDIIQPYRLEMGTDLRIGKSRNLYHFWKNILGNKIREEMERSDFKFLLNLASQEYFEAIDLAALKFPVVNIHFREMRNGKLSFLSFFAKKARGLMTRYAADVNCEDISQIKDFNLERYTFDQKLSSKTDWYFIR